MKTAVDTNSSSNTKEPLMSRMIGSINESFISINGQKCTALIDTG